jgi:tRNA threonylcarbamoyladenosine biosynthesis protein TsaB
VRVLSFDTSTEFLSVCLFDPEGVTLRTRSGPVRHGANLAPLIRELFRESGVPGISQVDLVAFPAGPGSFTGLRIGYATAKGLAAARGGDLPLVAVPTLDIHGWRRRDRAGKVMPLLDARKGRFYTALFEGGERLTDDRDAAPEELLSLYGEEAIFLTGFHAHLAEDRLGTSLPSGWVLDHEAGQATAVDLAGLALEYYANGSYLSEAAGPHYVRRSDAELARGGNRGETSP